MFWGHIMTKDVRCKFFSHFKKSQNVENNIGFSTKEVSSPLQTESFEEIVPKRRNHTNRNRTWRQHGHVVIRHNRTADGVV